MSPHLASLAIGIALLGQAPAPRPAAPPRPTPSPAVPAASGDVEVKRCIVTLINEVQLPARAPGAILEFDVVEGSLVEVGQVLARIDDRDVAAKLNVTLVEKQVSELQASKDVKVKAARAAFAVAHAEYEQGARLMERKAISESEFTRLGLARDRAQFEMEAADLEFQISQLVVKARGAQEVAARDEIERRRVVAPVAGVVEKVIKHVGEWCNPGDPLLLLLQMDRLRVEGFVPAAQYAKQDLVGKPVTVYVELAAGPDGKPRLEPFTGVVGYASDKIDASGEYRIWVEIQNKRENGQWLVQAGRQASMTIHLKK